MKQSIQDIDPEVYRAVEVELEGEHLIEDLDEVDWGAVQVKNIVIHVYSDIWDNLNPDKKVDLLTKTSRLLKTRYPKTTSFVTLKFDDKRQDLKLQVD